MPIAPTFVQKVANHGGNAGAITVAVTIASSASKNLLVVYIGMQGVNAITSVTDNVSNTYTAQFSNTTAAGATVGLFCYACLGCTAGATTVTVVTTGGNLVDVIVYEFHAASAATWTLDQSVTNGLSGSGTSATSNATAATTQANEIAVASIMVNNTVPSAGTAGWTGASDASTGWTEYKILTATGAQTATFTISAAQNYIAGVGTWFAQAAVAMSGTCVTTIGNSGTLRSTKLLSGTCVISSVNTGKISRFLLGTCTAKFVNAGKISRFLLGTCTLTLVNSGVISRLLSGSCIVRVSNIGILTATKPLTGVCIAASINAGELLSYRVLSGLCLCKSVVSGILVLGYICNVKITCSGSLSLLFGLFRPNEQFVSVQTMTARQVEHIMPPGAFMAFPVNMTPAPAFDATTQKIEIHNYTIGTTEIRPVWYVSPQTDSELIRSAALSYYSNIITRDLVSSFLFADSNWGSLTTGNKDVLLQQLVEGVNAILVFMGATMKKLVGTCSVHYVSSGGELTHPSRMSGGCTFFAINTGILTYVIFMNSTCTVQSAHTGVLS